MLPGHMVTCGSWSLQEWETIRYQGPLLWNYLAISAREVG